MLEARGIAVPAKLRRRITACTDLAQLETWLRRAASAASVDDVLARQARSRQARSGPVGSGDG